MEEEPIYWKMRDGSSISIDDMDINHLRNTLKMIIKNSTKPKSKPEYEFKMNGEMAQEDEDRYYSEAFNIGWGSNEEDYFKDGMYYALIGTKMVTTKGYNDGKERRWVK